jgi:hypothetical protein
MTFETTKKVPTIQMVIFYHEHHLKLLPGFQIVKLHLIFRQSAARVLNVPVNRVPVNQRVAVLRLKSC